MFALSRERRGTIVEARQCKCICNISHVNITRKRDTLPSVTKSKRNDS
jgi:hypothetical protein